MEQNPYAPTKAALNEVSPEAPTEGLEQASRWRRLANLAVDAVGIVIAAMLIGLVLGIVGVALHIEVVQFMDNAFGFAVVILYYLVSETLFGRTLGKLVTGTRVVAESGSPALFWQILARTLYRFVPLEAFSFLSTSRPGWHDRWSKTRVAKVRRN